MSSEYLAEQAKKFSRLHSLDEEGCARDRQEGAAIFLRLNDRERLELVASMIEAWACDLPLNSEAPRVSRRLLLVRRRSHDEQDDEQVFT